MLKKYQELLGTLETAAAQARAIVAAGGQTERVYRGLSQPIREVRDRVSYIQEVESRAKATADAATTSTPTPTPAQTPTVEKTAGVEVKADGQGSHHNQSGAERAHSKAPERKE